jgi:hypothetical protein
MRYFLSLFWFVLAFGEMVVAQTIQVVGFVGNPQQVVLDKWGNIYSTNLMGNTVVKIDTNGLTSTIAGNGSAGFSGDGGPATNAELHEPGGVAIAPNGDIYISDLDNQVIRMVSATSGFITTIAGTGYKGFSGDGGPATSAWLNVPGYLQFDKSGNLYFTDGGNFLIRKIDTFGIISSVAGNRQEGISVGDGGIATSASILAGTICLDANHEIFLCGGDYLLENIRKVDSNGIIHGIFADSSNCTFLGDGVPVTTACLEPLDLVVGRDGTIYFTGNNRIQYIDTSGYVHTLAGTGVEGYSGDGGPASAAEVGNVTGITMDDCGNIYFAENEHGNIRKITFDSTCPHAVAGVRQAAVAAGLQLSPNPATAVLYVAAGVPLGRVSVMNPAGETVFSVVTEATRTDIPIEKLPPGLYLLRQDTPAGETSIRKFIKR